MPIIDADTHVDETEDTWEYMLPSEQDLKPVVGYPSNPDPSRPATRYWLIDGERPPLGSPAPSLGADTEEVLRDLEG